MKQKICLIIGTVTCISLLLYAFTGITLWAPIDFAATDGGFGRFILLFMTHVVGLIVLVQGIIR